MATIKRLNHLVLYVSDVSRAEGFYRDILGFVVVEKLPQAVFMRASGSDNHHDLGLIFPGPNAVPLPSGPRIGLYHAAWEVEAIEQLADVRQTLREAGVFIGESDHGNSLSVYALDPDGNEFEVFWMVPRSEWPSRKFGVNPLHLEAEIARRQSPKAV